MHEDGILGIGPWLAAAWLRSTTSQPIFVQPEETALLDIILHTCNHHHVVYLLHNAILELVPAATEGRAVIWGPVSPTSQKSRSVPFWWKSRDMCSP